MSYNPLGVAGGKALAEGVKYARSLTTLRLGWCKLDKAGGRVFGDCLRSNSVLTSLDLRGNKLEDEGCAALAAALQYMNETLSDLDLGYNEIKDKGAYSLAAALKANASGGLATVAVANNYITRLGEAALTEAAELVGEIYRPRELRVTF